MTIDIHKPELEALIQDWMRSGLFQTVEDALMEALKSVPLPMRKASGPLGERTPIMGSVLVAAMQAYPGMEMRLEPESYRAPVRDVAL
jgi:hypothetical protein